MDVFGRRLDRTSLLRYAPLPESVSGMRRVVLDEGRAAGHRAIEVRTSAGFELLVSADRCLDLLEARFHGIPLGFMSKNGITGREDFLPVEDGFVRSWPGGLLATCGLRNTGPSCRDEGEFHPIHGRIGSMPAEGVSTLVTEDGRYLGIEGTVRETALFGPSLRLRRRLRVPADGSWVEVEDVVDNETPEPQAVLVLYHYNLGFPFLEEGCRVTASAGALEPRNEESARGLSEAGDIVAPIDGWAEQVFFRLPADDGTGWAWTQVENPRLRLAVRVSHELAELPLLVQWKSMRSGDYALGLEPSNSRIRGRAGERAAGAAPVLAAFGRRIFRTRLEVFDMGTGRT